MAAAARQHWFCARYRLPSGKNGGEKTGADGMKRGTKRAQVAGGLVATAVVGVAVWATTSWARFDGAINSLGVALDAPAALIVSDALSSLPRDLVKAPVLRDLLTEDLVFYYEDLEDRLNLRGALKRLAFERETTLTDKLLDVALDEPAELAMWLDGKNAPRHWALAMTRGTLAKALQGVGSWVAKDKQLTLIAEVKLHALALTTQPVYALQLSSRRTLAISSLGNRVVVLSDPGLLFDATRNPDGKAIKVLNQLLSGEAAEQSPWRQHFGLVTVSPGHTLVAGSDLLAMGWQHFFPAMKALRVEVGPGGTTLRSAMRQQGSWAPGPWAALPAKPAACAALPVDWARVSSVVTRATKTKSVEVMTAFAPLVQQADGSAAVCWYAGSQLHTPLWVVRAKGSAPDAAVVQAFMRWWMTEKASFTEDQTPAGAQALVKAPWGTLTDGDEAAYAPRLQRVGDWWMFSPDAALVARAADVVARRYPSVADTIGERDRTVALATPQAVAELAKRETLAVLTPQQADFKQAIERQLWPRLAALARLQPTQAVLSSKADSQGWTALDWQPMKQVKP
jgi:uncharacterized protein YfaA (DUF2138 family)